MTIYVETNFVQELIFEQEQHESCEKILELGESEEVRIVIPAYCLAEPQEKLKRQETVRKKLTQDIGEELKQLERSASFSGDISTLEKITSLFLKSNEAVKQRFLAYRNKLLAVAEIIPLNSEILKAGIEYEYDRSNDLQPQDALVFASVMQHLDRNCPKPCCFLTKDKDFNNPSIETELEKFSCSLIFRFDQGYEFARRPQRN